MYLSPCMICLHQYEQRCTRLFLGLAYSSPRMSAIPGTLVEPSMTLPLSLSCGSLTPYERMACALCSWLSLIPSTLAAKMGIYSATTGPGRGVNRDLIHCRHDAKLFMSTIHNITSTTKVLPLPSSDSVSVTTFLGFPDVMVCVS